MKKFLLVFLCQSLLGLAFAGDILEKSENVRKSLAHLLNESAKRSAQGHRTIELEKIKKKVKATQTAYQDYKKHLHNDAETSLANIKVNSSMFATLAWSTSLASPTNIIDFFQNDLRYRATDFFYNSQNDMNGAQEEVLRAVFYTIYGNSIKDWDLPGIDRVQNIAKLYAELEAYNQNKKLFCQANLQVSSFSETAMELSIHKYKKSKEVTINDLKKKVGKKLDELTESVGTLREQLIRMTNASLRAETIKLLSYLEEVYIPYIQLLQDSINSDLELIDLRFQQEVIKFNKGKNCKHETSEESVHTDRRHAETQKKTSTPQKTSGKGGKSE